MDAGAGTVVEQEMRPGEPTGSTDRRGSPPNRSSILATGHAVVNGVNGHGGVHTSDHRKVHSSTEPPREGAERGEGEPPQPPPYNFSILLRTK